VIVADSNLLAALVFGGPDGPAARAVLQRDPAWAVPLLWRSEFANVIAGHMRQRGLSVGSAVQAHEFAASVIAGREYSIPAAAVFEIVAATKLSAYDAEFVALARSLRTALVTADKQLLRECKDVAVTAEEFVR
jgi:predicted nucleic acid-binding protein